MARAYIDIQPIIGSPRWAADFTDQRDLEHFPAKVDATQFIDKDAVLITASAAIQTATSVTITPAVFSGGITRIPSGTILYFGGAKVAQLTADYTGGTTLAVASLPTALAGGETAYFKPFGTRVYIPSGILMGRTYVERDAGTGFGPAVSTDDEIFLNFFEITDALTGNNVEFYRGGRTVKENYLPGYADGRNNSGGVGLSTAANAVQTVLLPGTLSAGTYQYGDGLGNYSTPVAYNANLAAIQTGLDSLFGASKVVAAGTVPSHTVTWSGTGVSGKPQTLMTLDTSALTGVTAPKVQNTVVGGMAILALLRSRYRCIIGVN